MTLGDFAVGFSIGASLDIGLQVGIGYATGDGYRIDWKDVVVSGLVGGFAPVVTAATKGKRSLAAIAVLAEQLGRARTWNRISKLQGRLLDHWNALERILVYNGAWQSFKYLFKAYADDFVPPPESADPEALKDIPEPP